MRVAGVVLNGRQWGVLTPLSREDNLVPGWQVIFPATNPADHSKPYTIVQHLDEPEDDEDPMSEWSFSSYVEATWVIEPDSEEIAPLLTFVAAWQLGVKRPELVDQWIKEKLHEHA